MENIFRYYEFSSFFIDTSGAFLKNEICFSELNKQHFLIFEKELDAFNLYVAKYGSKSEIGTKPPEIVEVLVKNYNKSVPEHRIILRKYLY